MSPLNELLSNLRHCEYFYFRIDAFAKVQDGLESVFVNLVIHHGLSEEASSTVCGLGPYLSNDFLVFPCLGGEEIQETRYALSNLQIPRCVRIEVRYNESFRAL